MPTQEFLARILIVDDDPGLRETLRDFLGQEGYETLEAANVTQARAHFVAGSPDLILLDLNMPGGNGLTLAAEVRSRAATPIIIISGKGQMIDRVVGLEIGADDYLGKPFELRELLARIRAVLRRSAPAVRPTDVEPASVERAAVFGAFVLTPGRRQLAIRAGPLVDLTGAEYNLLAAFIERPNRVLTREAIADLIQNADADTFDRSIDTLVSRLRRKLEPHVDAARLIQTVRGEGYVLASDVTWSVPTER